MHKDLGLAFSTEGIVSIQLILLPKNVSGEKLVERNSVLTIALLILPLITSDS